MSAQFSLIESRLAKLCQVGIALSNEQNLDKLLDLILTEARAFTRAEGATLYLRRGEILEFAVVQNEVLERLETGYPKSFQKHKLPLSSSSLCGRSALSGKILNIPEVSQFSDTGAVAIAREFDRINNYLTKSLLIIPLRDLESETVAVLQLVNARSEEGQVIPFDPAYEQLIGALASQAAIALKNTLLTTELQLAYEDTLFRLSMAADYRDDVTGAHIKRISQYSALVAEAYGLDARQVEKIRVASPMHDIGKIAIPDVILLKNGPLTPEEYAIMKKHPEIGAKILGNAKSDILQVAQTIALTHHEKFDGSGYPRGLQGTQIPIEGRLVAIADVFDALTTRRCYKPAYSAESAMESIAKESGAHFDPDAVKAFLKVRDKILAAHQQMGEAYQPPKTLKPD